MSKWTEVILRTVMGLIMGIAAILTTVILSPFLFLMWLIKLFNKWSDGEDR